jgi:L-lactate dehydrogenase complex protein LldG
VTAREEILARIRTALADGGPEQDAGMPREYLRSHSADADLAGLFADRVADYRAVVSRVPAGGVPAAVAAAAGALGLAEIVAAPGFPADWLPRIPGVRWLSDDPPLSVDALDRCSAALTTAALGIAVTGTIVLDARGGQGRRALTLVPDVHLCVIRADQIVADVPDAIGRLDPVRPLTLISGPSATSDIELERVEGVHGPRTLHVIIAEGSRR